jgi:V8-like Glu-specific endopeptidase
MIRMRTWSLLLIGLLLTASGCGKQNFKGPSSKESQFSQSLSIIRDNNLFKVPENPDIYDFLLPSEILNAIGRMDIGCTVTHIGNQYGITAGHCLANPYIGGDRAFYFVKDVSCNYMSRMPLSTYNVSFGVRGRSNGHLTGQCEKIIIAEYSRDLDFAIIKLTNAPDEAIWLKENSKAIQGNKVTIYSHPNKRALEWSSNCSLLHRRRDGLNRIQYDCDTEGGSSGAAVLDVETSDIVAIHTNGTQDTYFGHNSGQPIQDIIKKLKLELNL